MSSREEYSINSGDPPDSTINFDCLLPMMHSYLGQNLEELPGRTVLDDWSFHKLPLYTVQGLVLVPGQTLPLNENVLLSIQMLRRCIQRNHLFGTISLLPMQVHDSPRLADVGTVAEIYECRSADDTMCVKAIGRQRFRLIETKMNSDGLEATVQILPEIILPDPMSEIRLNTLDRFRSVQDNEANTEKLRSIYRREATTSQWPSWVFSQFRISTLVARVKELLEDFDLGPNIVVPTDPVTLSFWLIRTIPLEDCERVAILRLNSAIMRLQHILKKHKRLATLCCVRCHSPVADQKDMFSMSIEGAVGAYVNPSGFIHEVITVSESKHIELRGAVASTEFSWFPGYAWRIAQCEVCSEHLGWLFTSVQPHLKPAKFWALARRSIETRKEKSDKGYEEEL